MLLLLSLGKAGEEMSSFTAVQCSPLYMLYRLFWIIWMNEIDSWYQGERRQRSQETSHWSRGPFCPLRCMNILGAFYMETFTIRTTNHKDTHKLPSSFCLSPLRLTLHPLSCSELQEADLETAPGHLCSLAPNGISQ